MYTCGVIFVGKTKCRLTLEQNQNFLKNGYFSIIWIADLVLLIHEDT